MILKMRKTKISPFKCDIPPQIRDKWSFLREYAMIKTDGFDPVIMRIYMNPAKTKFACILWVNFQSISCLGIGQSGDEDTAICRAVSSAGIAMEGLHFDHIQPQEILENIAEALSEDNDFIFHHAHA